MRTFETAPAPHLPPRASVRALMLEVLIALVPGVLAYVYFFGPGLLVQIALAVLFALLVEAACLKLRGRALLTFLGDGSAVLAAVLFALCLPPLAPWWVSALGMAVGIGLAKHAYGGLGYNLFNPAMVGYAVVLVSFPLELSQWLAPRGLGSEAPGLIESLRIILVGAAPGAGWDAISMATPLDTVRQLTAQGQTLVEIRSDPRFGDFGGRGWEWVANFFALGGLWLLIRRKIPWQTPAATLGSVILLSLPFWAMEPDLHPFPLQHVFSGALVLAAFFIVTDPVSGCSTPRGRLIFGAGVGVLTLAIRRWGSYPDAIAFAVLLMNCAAPFIDRYTRPRVYGAPR
ncbi:RnfABCDGE type electron transport complex subunit D [uncultured Aquimonas sp.]|uniref:RnfABCDGE type electron transport complex subunit D n=1 Tax=uncultured Aquimonas sp. TaxID=385483 RepID=UPI000A612544|nr:RnfABCDGE type electron transport complex subunit D [uncultured Aquimonas sp.]